MRDSAGPHGLLPLDKACGMTSRVAVDRVGRLLGTRAIGHAGTLDPDASGVLWLGCGAATPFLRWVQDAAKTYQAVVQFGSETISDDAASAAVREAPWPDLELASLRDHAADPPGWVDQVPPAVSALQRDGVRDHERVRRGEVVARAPRPVWLQSVHIDAVDPAAGRLTATLTVGSGFYVRAWARDLGRRLGSAAHLVALRRLAAGGIAVARCHTLEQLAEVPPHDRGGLLWPVERVLAPLLPVWRAAPAIVSALRCGKRPVVAELAPAAALAVLDEGGLLVAVCEAEPPAGDWAPSGLEPDLRDDPAVAGVRLRVLRGHATRPVVAD